MAWSVLQSTSASQPTNNVASVAATYSTASLTSGTKLIAAVTVSGNGSTGVTASTVSDGSSNNFTKVGAQTLAGNSVNGEVSLWAVDTPAGDVGTKPTITATFSVATNAGCAIVIQEVSGLASGSTLAAMVDGTAGTNSGSGGASTGSPSYSSTAANEYLVSAAGDDNSVSNATYTKPGAGWTLDTSSLNASGPGDDLIAYISSAGAAETASWARTNVANHWATILVAFKLAASVTGTPQPPQYLIAGSAARVAETYRSAW